MAKITKIIVISVDSADLNQQHWQWNGICLCGQQVADIELGEIRQMLVNISVTVCTTCEAAAGD